MKIRIALILPFLLYSFITYSQTNEETEQESEEEETEFAEPLFVDTSTDIGGEKGVLEINVIPGIFDMNNNRRLSQLGFEFEYVLFENFGVEIEPVFLFSKSGDSTSNGFGDLEIETQYTFFADEKNGFAGGVEFLFPTGNEKKGFGEGEFELEPFLTYIYKTPFDLSLHPRISLDIPLGSESNTADDDDDDDDDESEEGIALNYNLGLLYTFENEVVLGVELTGAFLKNGHSFLIAPQVGIELDDFYIGAGVQVPFNKELFGGNYNASLRLIYEIEFNDN